jgi:hypothetical protein
VKEAVHLTVSKVSRDAIVRIPGRNAGSKTQRPHGAPAHRAI